MQPYLQAQLAALHQTDLQAQAAAVGGRSRHSRDEKSRAAQQASVSRQFFGASNARLIEAHLFYPALGYKKIKTQAVYEKDVSANPESRTQRLTTS